MSVQSELTRLKRDVDSLAEELATSVGPRPKLRLSPSDRRAFRADLQALIQQLDELAAKLSG
jgi:hypothetical protein